MGKLTVTLNFEGNGMKDVIDQMIEFLQSVGVFKHTGGEQRDGEQTEES